MVNNNPPPVHVTTTQTHHLGEEHKVTKQQTQPAKIEESKASPKPVQQSVVSKAKAIFEHPQTAAQSKPVGPNHHGKVAVPTPANNVATKVALANMGFPQLSETEQKGSDWDNLGLRDRTYLLFQEKLKNTPFENNKDILDHARAAIEDQSERPTVDIFKELIADKNSLLLKMLGDAEIDAVNSFR